MVSSKNLYLHLKKTPNKLLSLYIEESGYGGFYKTELVDRRFYPMAIPLAKNKLMGIPEPKKINIEFEHEGYSYLAEIGTKNVALYIYKYENGGGGPSFRKYIALGPSQEEIEKRFIEMIDNGQIDK